ncbi:MAG: HAD family phosphatase [Ruminococcaceae bacterium]|nr:HAD family phosphatase [Oscillospiraceae bacterium]
MDYSTIALFSDLDGTLLDSRRRVSPENRDALEYFIAQGGLFGISTGRAPANALTLVGNLPMNSWSVVLNGAEAYHFPTRTVAFPRTLTRIRMAVFLQEVLEKLPEVMVMVCSESRIFFLSDRERMDRDFLETHQPARFVTMTEALAVPWLKVMFCAPKPTLQKLEQGAAKRGILEISTRVYTGPEYLELLPVGTNKGACLKNLRTMDELRGRKIVAIGDWLNDLELLGEADIAVAVENALPVVKHRADILTRSNDEHALAQLIDDLLPGL